MPTPRQVCPVDFAASVLRRRLAEKGSRDARLRAIVTELMAEAGVGRGTRKVRFYRPIEPRGGEETEEGELRGELVFRLGVSLLAQLRGYPMYKQLRLRAASQSEHAHRPGGVKARAPRAACFRERTWL